MRSIFSENGNLKPYSDKLAGKSHKSMITLWLVVLFALWVVLTTALAVTARHSKSRKTDGVPADQPTLRAGNLRSKGARLSPSGAGLEPSASANAVINPSRSLKQH